MCFAGALSCHFPLCAWKTFMHQVFSLSHLIKMCHLQMDYVRFVLMFFYYVCQNRWYGTRAKATAPCPYNLNTGRGRLVLKSWWNEMKTGYISGEFHNQILFWLRALTTQGAVGWCWSHDEMKWKRVILVVNFITIISCFGEWGQWLLLVMHQLS